MRNYPKGESTSLNIRDYTKADWKFEKVLEQIRDFEAKLDDEHEVAVFLASFNKEILLTVTSISYENPDIFYFNGTVNGNPSRLIQHISQLNFLMIANKKCDPTRPPIRIGFAVPDENTETQ